jgi:multiple antibiotic resistance protein
LLIWTSFLLAFTALLPLINPLGSAVVFMGLMGSRPAGAFRSVARKVAINNVIFLAVIQLLGSAILRFFGISLPIVQVAGGIVISSIGWTMLNEKTSQVSMENKQMEAVECMDGDLAGLEDRAFYPFTFPITSGPGTLVVTLTLSAHIASASVIKEVFGHLGLFLAIVLISALVYVCYAFAPRLTQAVRPSTVHGVIRVMAFILLCIGVKIGWTGLAALVMSLKAS